MSDYMLLEYLRNKGMRGDEHKLIHDFKRYMKAKGMGGYRRHKDFEYDDDQMYTDWEMPEYDMYHKARYAKESMQEGAFDEFEAKEIVSKMYHYDMNRRHTGEHFDMKKATEVYDKFKEHFVVKATPADVYIAINAFYHDFCALLKTWFSTTVDEKIIMLAITFWFKDDDYQGNKLMDYFM
jgi:hypothetical protein